MTENQTDNELMPRWRYDELRSANVDGLRIASSLLAHFEGVYTMEKDDVYHELVKLNSVLAQGLYKGTQL